MNIVLPLRNIPLPSAKSRMVAGAGIVLATLIPASANADDWPTGSVQLIVPAAAGGGTDAVARIFATALQQQIGSPFVVVNNGGGGGLVAASMVQNAAPDGQTLLFFHTGIFAMHHTGTMSEDPMKIFTPVAVLPASGSYALVVSANSDYQTADDLVAAAIAAPNSISLGVGVRGSTHFMAGLLMKDSGAEFRIVDAGADAEKLVQLQGRQIHASLINTAGTMQYVENGTLRILGTISGTPGRDPTAPDIPTLVELGYESAVYGLDFIVLGPKDMSEQTSDAIYAAIAQVMADSAVSEQLESMRMPLTIIPNAETDSYLGSLDSRIEEIAGLLGLN